MNQSNKVGPIYPSLQEFYATSPTNQTTTEPSGLFNQSKVVPIQSNDKPSLQKQTLWAGTVVDDKPITKRQTESLWAKFCNIVTKMAKAVAVATGYGVSGAIAGALSGHCVGTLAAVAGTFATVPAGIVVGAGIGFICAFIVGFISYCKYGLPAG